MNESPTIKSSDLSRRVVSNLKKRPCRCFENYDCERCETLKLIKVLREEKRELKRNAQREKAADE